MACFLVPMTLAIITTIFAKKIPAKYHIKWLNIMLWGGVAMLIIEHIAHQEIVPYFPFFTKGFGEMFPELMVVGLPMMLGLVCVWILMILIFPKLQHHKYELHASVQTDI